MAYRSTYKHAIEMNRYILLTIVAAFTLSVAHAEQSVAEVAASKADTTVTKTSFLPTSRRIDRQIDRNKFVFKGEVMLGLTASHGRLNVEDSDLMLLLDNIDLGLNSTTVKPLTKSSAASSRSSQALATELTTPPSRAFS